MNFTNSLIHNVLKLVYVDYVERITLLPDGLMNFCINFSFGWYFFLTFTVYWYVSLAVALEDTELMVLMNETCVVEYFEKFSLAEQFSMVISTCHNFFSGNLMKSRIVAVTEAFYQMRDTFDIECAKKFAGALIFNLSENFNTNIIFEWLSIILLFFCIPIISLGIAAALFFYNGIWCVLFFFICIHYPFQIFYVYIVSAIFLTPFPPEKLIAENIIEKIERRIQYQVALHLTDDIATNIIVPFVGPSNVMINNHWKTFFVVWWQYSKMVSPSFYDYDLNNLKFNELEDNNFFQSLNVCIITTAALAAVFIGFIDSVWEWCWWFVILLLHIYFVKWICDARIRAVGRYLEQNYSEIVN